MKQLMQVRNANGQIFPSPRLHEVLYETPPTFCWLREEGVSVYRVAVRQGDDIVWQGDTERNFLVPDRILEPGQYEWNLYGEEAERGWQTFSIAENAVRFLRPDAREIFDAVPDVRPRHLFFAEDAAEIVKSHPQAVDTLRRNIALALQDGLPVPPMYHMDENALPYREYFGRHRDFCDRNLIACALGHRLLGDAEAARQAKELLMTLCNWNSEGPCSLESIWGDEIGLSHARCLPAAFDLCYDLLDGKQRIFVARVVSLYAYQCERKLNGIDFCQNPGNSHAGRLPAYLGEAAMALKGTGVVPEETLIRWLTLAIDIYGGIFPYFGGSDGGWAEGMFYASSYTKWFLPFFSAVRRYSGVDFMKRPFYQRFVRYLQHFCPPGWEIHPFGDGYWCRPDDIEWPGFFAQNPYHIYAERFGGELLRAWSKQAQQQEIFKLHLLDVFLPEGEPEPDSLAGDAARIGIFPDAGYLSLHTDPAHPEKELALLARASRYGSHSHSHADQGSFALMSGGTALIAPSGYFGRKYGSKHHYEWTNQTVAHNTILVNGEGQKPFSYEAVGKVIGAREEGGVLTGEIDQSEAYEHVERWTRRFELTAHELVVTDHIELDAPGEITYLLHSLSKPEETGEGMTLFRNGVRLDICPEAGGLIHPVIEDRYAVDLNEGEPEKYWVTMPQQYHMKWTAEKKQIHDIRVRFCVQMGEEA